MACASNEYTRIQWYIDFILETRMLMKLAVWRSGRRARKALLMSLAVMYIKVPYTFYRFNETPQ